MLRARRPALTVLMAAAMLLPASGCTSFREYFSNGLKVGPNYCRPPAPVAQHWIDATDIRVRQDCADLSTWWSVFNDPVLSNLIVCAYRQNLTLRQAGFRILEARAELGIAVGEIFPQQQSALGDYRRIASSGASSGVPTRYSNQWDLGFSLAWELDFWGRFRRAVTAAEDQLDASVANYDDALVTLLGDVATAYVVARTAQEEISLLQANAELQRGVLSFIEKRFQAGFRVSELDLDQAKSNLAQTEAQIPQLEIAMRQATNAISLLLGMPPVDTATLIGTGPIPTTPAEVAAGIPAELLRRRPDIRRAERLAAAQAEEIGIAQADLYPTFTLNGTLGYQASELADLFRSNAFNGSIGPSFRWNILNYGRIENNVKFQDARFQELVTAYQSTVLQAQREVENGLVTFLRAQQRMRLLSESVDAAQKAVKIVVLQYEKGAVDFNRYALIEQNLVQQQDLLAQSRGQIAQGLIQVYRAAGGGWQIRCAPGWGTASMPTSSPPGTPAPGEGLPPPTPETIPAPRSTP